MCSCRVLFTPSYFCKMLNPLQPKQFGCCVNAYKDKYKWFINQSLHNRKRYIDKNVRYFPAIMIPLELLFFTDGHSIKKYTKGWSTHEGWGMKLHFTNKAGSSFFKQQPQIASQSGTFFTVLYEEGKKRRYRGLGVYKLVILTYQLTLLDIVIKGNLAFSKL